MSVQIVASKITSADPKEEKRSYFLGDALRDLYDKRLLRKHFILLGTDTITNANLYDILQTHMYVEQARLLSFRLITNRKS